MNGRKLHLFRRTDSQDLRPVFQRDHDRFAEGEARLRQFNVFGYDAVPVIVWMEESGQFLEIEGYAVGLSR